MSDADRHLWQFRWVRDLMWLLGAVAVLWLAYTARSVLAPALAGLALAYAVNPLVTWLERRGRVPRWASTAGIILVGVVALLAVLVTVAPPLVNQSVQLARNLPVYVERIVEELEIELPDWRSRPTAETGEGGGIPEDAVDGVAPVHDAMLADEGDAAPPEPRRIDQLRELPWVQIGQVLLQGLNVGVSVVSGVVGLVSFLILAGVVMLFSFFFFSWKFGPIVHWCQQFVPDARRQRVYAIVGKMDRSVAGFIRGRLIQAAAVAVILSVGWKLAGVPYWLLLGLGAGVLNLIPYAAFVGWPAAILLTWVDRMSGGGFSVMAVFVWPSVVYLLAQGVDGWVIEPLVQGKATALDPLAVMLAVLVGAAVAGLLGMLLAIPIAACAKILAQEVILPNLRERIRSMSETT